MYSQKNQTVGVSCLNTLHSKDELTCLEYKRPDSFKCPWMTQVTQKLTQALLLFLGQTSVKHYPSKS